MPPPIALYNVHVKSNIVDCSFNAPVSRMAVLQATDVTFFDIELQGNWMSEPKLLKTVSLTAQTRLTARQIVFDGETSLVVLAYDEEEKTDILIFIDSNEEREFEYVRIGRSVSSLVSSFQSMDAFVLDMDGSIYSNLRQLTFELPGEAPEHILSIPFNVRKIEIANAGQKASHPPSKSHLC